MAADGVFGPATERAVKRWQRRHGLVADGIVGPQTRSAMGLGSGPVLKRKRTGARARRGHSGRAHHRSHGGGGVRSLQRRIGVPADGVFGPGTEAALKRWQAAHGLVPDGVAGPQTRAKLGLGPRTGAEAAWQRRRRRLARRRAHPPPDQGGEPDRHRAVQVRRRPRHLPRQRLRLLWLDLIRPALRGSAADAARLERLHELRPPRPRPAHHHLCQRGPRLHGRRRPPLRHQRDPRDGLALDEHAPLHVGLRGPPPV